MISRAQIQFIRSLELKKFRDESECFIAEGDKLVREALALPDGGQYRIIMVCGTEDWISSINHSKSNSEFELITVSDKELERISVQKSPNKALAVIRRDQSILPVFDFNKDLLIGLNEVQDPGNVGTIIRIAEWFGIGGVIASSGSADFYSPKVVQSSMGSIFRVKLLTANLIDFIQSVKPGFPIYGTHLQGQSLYSARLTSHGLILMGNESRGLDAEMAKMTTENLLIPNYSIGDDKPESLNVSIATAVVCSEFRRRGTD